MTVLKLVRENGYSSAAETYTPIVTIHADAACLRNGSADSSAGCGAVVIDRNRMEMKLVAKHLGPLTNQQAEILACAMALEELRRPCRVELFSDSRYVIDAMHGRNRMRTNRLFWERLIEQSLGHHITWRWTKGHDRATFQKAAGRLSRAASTAGTDLLPDDLEFLAALLFGESDQLNIRSFELELDKIVSRCRAFKGKVVPAAELDGVAAYPSAFSA